MRCSVRELSPKENSKRTRLGSCSDIGARQWLPAGLQNPRRVSPILTAPAESVGSLPFGYPALYAGALGHLISKRRPSSDDSRYSKEDHMFTTMRGEDGTFYVFWRGQVIYKRWPSGVSRVFYLSAQI